MIKTTPAFQKTLDSLNDAQRQAVEGIQGPWMVLAGPGTGKTHMLAARIGNILLKEQLDPRNILCLTFTNAGVKAMRDRLVKFMGVAGSRVAVHTFHDFARDVIEEFPSLFNYVSWEAMDALDKYRLINELIDGLPPKHALRGPSHEPYTHGKDLLDLFGKMAQEAWTQEEVITAARQHIQDLPNLPSFVYKRKSKDKMPGDLNPAAIKQTERMERLILAAQLAEQYSQLKQSRSLYDYADQLSWLLQALRENESLRFQLQERYQYLLVDEYQDTNGIQNEILALLAEDDNPNLFVVGDDDQSIYGFQGARVQGLRDLADRYAKDLAVVVLRENYRSHDSILQAAQHVIGINQVRLLEIGGTLLEKTLSEGVSFAERPKPHVVYYPTSFAQAHYTAQTIKDWLAAGTKADEIGVIYRNHAQAGRLIECLELLDVPYRLQRSLNVLEQPLVRRLRGALSFIANLHSDRETVETHAFEFMLSPAIGLTATELFELNGYRFRQSTRVPSWRYLLTHPEVLEGNEVPFDHPERFRVAADLLNELGALVDRYPLATLVQQVVQRTGLLREALDGDERQLALECIDALIRDAQARVRKNPGLTLAELCATWDEMDEYDLPLGLEKQADTREAVSLMTAHTAKGLEFERVVMYEVTAAIWEKNSNRHRGFYLPPQLVFELDTDSREEENRRLFYVALTRAKQELLLTVPETTESGRGSSPAVSVVELLENDLATSSTCEVSDEELYETMGKLHGQELRPVAPLLQAAAAKTKWEVQDLNLRALTQFNRCKVGFYYQHVSDVTRAKRSVDRFTSSLHSTVQEFYRQATHPETLAFMSEEELVALFTMHLNRERAGIEKDKFEGYLAEGEAALRAWYQCEDDPKHLDVLLERKLAVTLPNGLRITGRIDRVDIDPSTRMATPVDYKIGDARAIEQGRSREGRYKCVDDRHWRQLAFYALLLRDGINSGVAPRQGKIVNLSPKGTTVQVVDLPPEAMELFEAELLETYNTMLDCDDYVGCLHDPEKSDFDKAKCSWCDFHYLKRNAVTLVTEEVEELDD